jgi:multiple sugar transport system permease protein
MSDRILSPEKATSIGRHSQKRLAWRLTPRWRERLFAYLCLLPWFLGFLTITAGGMIASLVISLYRTDMMSITRFVGLENFARLASDELTRKALVNTAVYSFSMVPLGTVTTLFIALLLNQQIHWQGFFRMVYYLPSIVSGVAVSILWAWLYHPDLGLLNGLLAYFRIRGPGWIYSEEWALPSFVLMGIWSSGGSMLIFLAGLQGIPTALYEAAQIDGANALHRFWHVTIPMLSPTIFFSVVMNIIGSFQIFTQAYVMTQGGPNNATLTMVLYIYRKAFQQFYFGRASALAWLLFAVIMLLTLLMFRSANFWVYYSGELKR